ncbi:hypothetical protein MXB_5589 [Myxobolus squamalis]|nr:hypothetical protein MXB_5589 [Myxobolus squamalis]
MLSKEKDKIFLCYALNQYEELVELAKKYLENNSDENIMDLCGVSYFKLKNYSNSEEYFKKSLQINPMNINCLNNILVLYQKTKSFENYASICLKLGQAYHYLKEYKYLAPLYVECCSYLLEHLQFPMAYQLVTQYSKWSNNLEILKFFLTAIENQLTRDSSTFNRLVCLRIFVRLIARLNYRKNLIDTKLLKFAFLQFKYFYFLFNQEIVDPCSAQTINSSILLSYIFNEFLSLISDMSPKLTCHDILYELQLNRILGIFFKNFCLNFNNEGFETTRFSLNNLNFTISSDSYSVLQDVSRVVYGVFNGSPIEFDFNCHDSTLIDIVLLLNSLARKNYSIYFHLSDKLNKYSLLEPTYTEHFHNFLRFWRTRFSICYGLIMPTINNSSAIFSVLNCELAIHFDGIEYANDFFNTISPCNLTSYQSAYYEYVKCLLDFHSGLDIKKRAVSSANITHLPFFDLSGDYFRLICTYKQKVRNRPSIKYLIKLCFLNPNDGYSFFLLGILFKKSRKFSAYQRAHDLGYRPLTLIIDLNNYYIETRQYQDYHMSVEIEAFLLYGCALMKVGSLISASSAFNESISIKSTPAALSSLARVFWIKKEFNEALKYYMASCETIGADILVHAEYCQFLLDYGKYLYSIGSVKRSRKYLRMSFFKSIRLLDHGIIFLELFGYICYQCWKHRLYISSSKVPQDIVDLFKFEKLSPLQFIYLAKQTYQKASEVKDTPCIHKSVLFTLVSYSIEELNHGNVLPGHLDVLGHFIMSLVNDLTDCWSWNAYASLGTIIWLFNIASSLNPNECEQELVEANVIDPDLPMIWYARSVIQKEFTRSKIDYCIRGLKFGYNKKLALLLMSIFYKLVMENAENIDFFLEENRSNAVACADQTVKTLYCCDPDEYDDLIRCYLVFVDVGMCNFIEKFRDDFLTRFRANQFDTSIAINNNFEISSLTSMEPHIEALKGYWYFKKEHFKEAIETYTNDDIWNGKIGRCVSICHYHMKNYRNSIIELTRWFSEGQSNENLILFAFISLKFPKIVDQLLKTIPNISVLNQDLSVLFIYYLTNLPSSKYPRYETIKLIVGHYKKFGCSLELAKALLYNAFITKTKQILPHFTEFHREYSYDKVYYGLYLIVEYIQNCLRFVVNDGHLQFFKHFTRFIYLFGHSIVSYTIYDMYILCCSNLVIIPYKIMEWHSHTENTVSHPTKFCLLSGILSKELSLDEIDQIVLRLKLSDFDSYLLSVLLAPEPDLDSEFKKFKSSLIYWIKNPTNLYLFNLIIFVQLVSFKSKIHIFHIIDFIMYHYKNDTILFEYMILFKFYVECHVNNEVLAIEKEYQKYDKFSNNIVQIVP